MKESLRAINYERVREAVLKFSQVSEVNRIQRNVRWNKFKIVLKMTNQNDYGAGMF